MVLGLFLTAGVVIIAGDIMFSLLRGAPVGDTPEVDYNAIVVILLTTVTVIFSFCAIVLAIIGIIGFRNLKINAGRYAETQVVKKIEGAFQENGVAIDKIDIEFRKEDGHFRPWMKERIRKEVIALLPLIADRALNGGDPEKANDKALAAGAPTDEGETN